MMKKKLQPWIDSCLKPKPKALLKIEEVHENTDGKFIASKPIDESTFDPRETF